MRDNQMKFYNLMAGSYLLSAENYDSQINYETLDRRNSQKLYFFGRLKVVQDSTNGLRRELGVQLITEITVWYKIKKGEETTLYVCPRQLNL